MPTRFTKIIITICLCGAFFLRPSRADDIESQLKGLEAKLIYEAAAELVFDEEYDKALRRLDWVISEYPETAYGKLATDKKGEIEILRRQPKPISGASRASLVGFGTLFTTWLGVGTLILLDTEDPAPYGLALIAGPLSGLTGSLNLTRDSKLSDGQASLINLGGAWGIWQAVGAARLADADAKPTVGASMAGGVIGLALASSIVSSRNISPGDATLINFGGIWGTWFAICGTMAAVDKESEDSDFILGSAMIGGDVGLLTMAAWAPKLHISRSRARLINIGGIVGTLYGLGANILLEIHPEDRSFWAIMGLGGMLGLTAGAHLTRNYDTEAGYFAESGVSLLNFESGEKKWNLFFPTITVSPINRGNAQIPGLELQAPLVHIKF